MGIMKNIIRQLAQQGEFGYPVEVGGIQFVLGVLNHEEMLLADGLIDMDEVNEELAGEDNELKVYSLGMETVRSLTRLALIIREVNGEIPIVIKGTTEERVESIKEFRRDLMQLDPVITDRLNTEYNKLIDRRSNFFKDSSELAKK